MENVLNRIISIERTNGDTIMAIEIDDKGNIVNFANCDIADIELDDLVFGTKKETIRLQAIEEEM